MNELNAEIEVFALNELRMRKEVSGENELRTDDRSFLNE